MTCEGCGARTEGFALFDYCEHCSKNLCATCLKITKCREPDDGVHMVVKDDDDDG